MNNHLAKQDEKKERRAQDQRVLVEKVKEEDDYRDYEPERTKKIKRQEVPVNNPSVPHVKQENVNPKLEEIAHPQWGYWQYTDEYIKEVNTFIKVDSDFLKVVRAKEPLPAQGIHSFQFKPCQLTTFSFGIITGKLKDYSHIGQKQVQALFLTSFQNRSSVLNVDGEIKHRNLKHQLHVGAGTSMKVKINLIKREIIFIKAGLIFKQPISHNFLGRQIYPFFQVKSRYARFEITKSS